MILDALTVALGLAVGLSLGALGGGGSTLAVPILVVVGGMTAQGATTASLLVVGVAAAVGVVGHLRAGDVRLGAGLAFGAAGIVGSRLGTSLNRALDERALLLSFSVLILFVALRMLRSVHGSGTADGSGGGDVDGGPGGGAGDDARARPGDADVAGARRSGSDGPSPGAIAGRHGDGVRVAARPAERTLAGADRPGSPGRRPSSRDLVRLALAATGVGVLTGLFGVGGGFAVVPALTLLLGFEAKEAIGTSLVVIAVNAAVALVLRRGELDLDWALVGPFLATVTVGVVAGSAIARRVAGDALTRAFAVMLATVAIWTATSTLLT